MTRALVFDFGASSGRAIIVGFGENTVESREIYRFANTPITRDGTLYWDIDSLFAHVETALKKACEVGFDSVSVDTWGVDLALVGDNGGFIERPVHYRDGRTRAVIDEVNGLFGGEKELYLKTGIQPAWFNTIYQLYALKKQRPESFKGAHLLMMPDLFCHFLTGELHNEYSEATTSSLLDPINKCWDADILSKLGIPQEIFCDIVYSGEKYGFLKQEFLYGGMRGKKIPVVCVASHDTASAVSAAPAAENEFAFVSTGTWALFGAELEKPIISEASYSAGLTNEGGHDGTTTFLKNIMGMWLLQEFKRNLNENGNDIGYQQMQELAETAEPRRYFIDPNDESFSVPCDMPKAIKSYIQSSGQGSDCDTAVLLRTVYDSLAAEFACTLDDIEKITGKHFETVYMFGGGTKDSLLCSLTALYTGRRVIAGPAEATALGNAAAALIGSGALTDISDARRIIRLSGLTKEYLPAQDISAEVKSRYRQLIKRR